MKLKKTICLLLASLTLVASTACNDSSSKKPSVQLGGTNNPASTTTSTDYEKGIVNGSDYLGAENGYFVQENQSEYAIVYPEGATANVTSAAASIQTYVHRLTGALLPVVSDEGKTYASSDKVISVGDTVYKKGTSVQTDVDYSTLKTGGYVIKNYGDIYIVDSGCAEGIVYAAYEFLRTFFKVEFLTYDYTYMEEADSVKAYDIDYVTVPDFPIRDYYAYSCWYQGAGFGAKLGINSPTYKSREDVYGTTDYYAYYGYYYDYNDTRSFIAREGHTIEALLYTDAYRNGYRSEPKERPANGEYPELNSNLPINYLPEHPEWFALTPDDPRTGSGGRSQEEVCYTNGLDDDGNYIEQPEDVAFEDMTLPTKMIQIIKTMILEETSEAALYLMLGHADYGDECICEGCQKAMQKIKTFGGMTARWANTIAKYINNWMEEENIEREVKFVIFAYDKSINAPVTWNETRTDCTINDASLELVDNIVIKMAYRNCVYHSLWDTSCEQNDTLRENFIAWTKIAKGFVIWDYTAVFSDYLFYLPNFGTIKDNYKYYQEIGVTHLLSQGVPSEYNFYDANLHQWVSSKLMWETDQDVNALIQKFNALYFGKYAKYVNDYVDMFENYFATKEGFHASTYYALDFTSPETYDLKMLLKTIEIIETAIDLVWADETLTSEQKEVFDHNLRAVAVTPQYMILDMNMIVDEKEKLALAVKLFENIDILKITYRQEGQLAANSFETMKESFGL